MGHLKHLEHVAVEDQLGFGAIAIALGDHLVYEGSEFQVAGEILKGIALALAAGTQMEVA